MMIFCEKLQLIRKSKGLTQEGLAEILGVSRQAVAKWESGQAYPDISNLIHLSEVFLVTVDYLVKDDECQVHPINEKKSQDGLFEFLIQAKLKTYAGNGLESDSSRPSSHDFQYSEGDLFYLDSYLGGEFFSGEEGVWILGQPVYAMNYHGRVLDHHFSGDFLKAALSKATVAMPFRGPEIFQDKDYIYRCSINGSKAWFQGYEAIYYQDLKVYECYFHGGSVK